ncbi:MAG: serine/threonine protein kinase, partial [Labilithrix sp.]|nr:serine/threonine protein kinase [Labilithrix sp.]
MHTGVNSFAPGATSPRVTGDPRMQTLGKYQLIAEMARGGMGIVYLAVASGPAGFSKLFVIKELKPELVSDGSFFEMFLEEARLAARLSHPNIVTTYEVGVDGQRPFIVMDYLEGESLARLLRKNSPAFTSGMQMRVLCHVLEGLEYAHHLTNFDDTVASVVHRDISPQNVFITFDGQVKIVDFGIAKASDTVVETQGGTFKGKPGYMAPEQLSGDVDPRADVFSVGVMLWEAAAGERMFKKMSQLEILTALIRGAIPALGDVKPDAPAELQRICGKATAKEPDDRYATARAMRLDLEAYLEAQGERVTMREVAATVGSLLEEQRKKLRQVIEKCITTATSGAAIGKLPSLAPSALDNATPSRNAAVIATMSGPPLSGTPDGAAMPFPPSAAPPARQRALPVALVVLGLVLTSALATLVILRMYDRVETRSYAAASALSGPGSTGAPSAVPVAIASIVAAPSSTPLPVDPAEGSAEAAHAHAHAPAAPPPATPVPVPVPV